MNRIPILMSCLVLVLLAPSALTAGKEKKDKAAEKRAEIDAMTSDTLQRLHEESARSRKYRKAAAGYAVFDNTKISFGLSGAGGTGVAVDKATGERTYMRMGQGGLSVGLGAQKYRVVFFFETKEDLDRFIEQGWKAETSANAVAGTEGANAEATFTDGMAFYQLTDKGLMLQADITGTKYWKSKKLNP